MRVELRHICKTFGRVRANQDISLTFEPSRIYAILGENGAGKSTLMKIMSGYQSADSGEVVVDGQVLDLKAPTDAIAHGIGMLYQDPLDFPPFTVLENFIAGRPGGVFPDREAARRQLVALSERFGFNLDPNAYVDSLTIGERQQLEILRLLSLNVRVMVMDEPTTGISAEQKTALFNVLKSLALDDGMTIILVSHKLEDVIELCHEAFVLRRGKYVGSAQIPCDISDLVSLMFGKVLARQERQPVRQVIRRSQPIEVPAPSRRRTALRAGAIGAAALMLLAFLLLPWITGRAGSGEPERVSGARLLAEGPDAELLLPALVQVTEQDEARTYYVTIQNDGWAISGVRYAAIYTVRKEGQTRPIVEQDGQWVIVKQGSDWAIVDPDGNPVEAIAGWQIDNVVLEPTADENIQTARVTYWDTAPLSSWTAGGETFWAIPKAGHQALEAIRLSGSGDPLELKILPNQLWYLKEAGLRAYQPSQLGILWYIALWLIPLAALGSAALTVWDRGRWAAWGRNLCAILAEATLVALLARYSHLGATGAGYLGQIGSGFWIALIALFVMTFAQDMLYAGAERAARRQRAAPPVQSGRAVLSAKGISVASRRLTVENVSVEVCDSEVIGLAGLDGSGQGEFMRVCTGLLRPFSGTVEIDGRPMTARSYHQFVEAGVAFLPAGRLEEGLIGGMTLTQHLALTLPSQLELNWLRLSPLSAAYIAVRNWRDARAITAERIRRFNVKGRPSSPIQTLSGGNQQRFALALLPTHLRLLLLEHPTRGLDVESALYIWGQLLERRADGTAIVFISAELDEIVAYSDRILVFFGGRATMVDQAADMTADHLGKLIGGYA